MRSRHTPIAGAGLKSGRGPFFFSKWRMTREREMRRSENGRRDALRKVMQEDVEQRIRMEIVRCRYVGCLLPYVGILLAIITGHDVALELGIVASMVLVAGLLQVSRERPGDAR